MRTFLIISLLFIASATFAAEQVPDCTGTDRWPASTAFTLLKNANLLTSDDVDFSKTMVIRIASEKIGKDLYHQVHDIKFVEKSGNIIEVITVNDASSEECSMSSADVFIINKHLK